MLNKYIPDKGIGIRIEKNIPVAAGLAGGSADAAEVLKGLNRLFELGLTEAELMEAGQQVGADVPFCIKGGTALAEGIGETITPIASMPVTYVLLVCPDITVSTAGVYQRLNLHKISVRPDIEELIKSIEEGAIERLQNEMINVLENVTAQEYKIIGEIKSKLIKAGAVASLMSGSGPTVFGLFEEKSGAVEAKRAIEAVTALKSGTALKPETAGGSRAFEAETADGLKAFEDETAGGSQAFEDETASKDAVEFAKTGVKCFITKTYNEEC